MLTIAQLHRLERLTYILESQYHDHCERNFGDRDKWTRHLMAEMEKFSEELNESPWDLFDHLLKTAKAEQAAATISNHTNDLKD